MDLSETQSAPLSDSILKILKSKNLDPPLKAATYYLAENFAYFSSWIGQNGDTATQKKASEIIKDFKGF